MGRSILKSVGASGYTWNIVVICVFFSVGGNVAGLFSMVLLRPLLRTRKISFVGLSLFGSLASNAMQMLLAIVFVYGNGGRYLLFPFFVVGTIGGIFVGYLVERHHSVFDWAKNYYRAAISNLS